MRYLIRAVNGEDMIRVNEELAEMIGAHIGDGSMGFYRNHPVISFFGHPKEDREYVRWISTLYQKYFGIKANLRKWSKVIGFQIFSKDAYIFFKSLGIPSGRKNDINIPPLIKKSGNKILSSFIRGIFDTDGTVYFEKRNTGLYPRIQLKITSKNITNSLNEILNNIFEIKSTMYHRRERKNWKMSYFVEVRGRKNLEKWISLIGFRNIKNVSKIVLWMNNINPQQSFDIRIKLLKGLKLHWACKHIMPGGSAW